MPYKKSKKGLSARHKKLIQKGAKKMKNLLYQNHILKKISNMTTANHFYGVRAVNDLHLNQGAVELSDRTTLVSGVDRLPLIVIPLRSIVNAGTPGVGILRLKQNKYDFENVESVKYLGSNGNIWGQNVDNLESRYMLHRYSQIKLLLYQNASKDAKYQIKLIKIKDCDLDPTNLIVTNTQRQNLRRLFYGNHCLRHQLTNPLIEDFENYTRDLKGKFSIVWEKEYIINEQHGQMEEASYHQVNIFRKFDQTVNFCENPTTSTISDVNYENPDAVIFPSNYQDPLPLPDVTKNMFLVITANSSTSDRDSATEYDKFTIDIATKSKYTTSSINDGR